MKSMKKLLKVGACVLALSAMSVTAFAASAYKTPAEAVAALTNREVQSVIDERTAEGKTYGTIANEAGALEAYKSEMLEIKQDILNQRVAAEEMTQAQANAIITTIKENQENCDGTGSDSCGLGKGAGFGLGTGQGRGMGRGAYSGSCLNS